MSLSRSGIMKAQRSSVRQQTRQKRKPLLRVANVTRHAIHRGLMTTLIWKRFTKSESDGENGIRQVPNPRKQIVTGLTASRCCEVVIKQDELKMVAQTSLFTETVDAGSGARFSPCRTWRYSLRRQWLPGSEASVMFIGLNPSTADETQDDPTIRRCLGFARYWGFGNLIMMNVYAFRATKPADMKAAKDPVGPGNDREFERLRSVPQLVVAAWGNHCLGS